MSESYVKSLGSFLNRSAGQYCIWVDASTVSAKQQEAIKNLASAKCLRFVFVRKSSKAFAMKPTEIDSKWQDDVGVAIELPSEAEELSAQAQSALLGILRTSGQIFLESLSWHALDHFAKRADSGLTNYSIVSDQPNPNVSESTDDSNKPDNISIPNHLQLRMTNDDFIGQLANSIRFSKTATVVTHSTIQQDTNLTATGIAVHSSKEKAKQIRILSIDGGGIRGVIPALILGELEKRLGRKSLHEVFHVIAGTSTGGILALGLTMPSSKGSASAKHSAASLAQMYIDDGLTIFPQNGRRMSNLIVQGAAKAVSRVPFAKAREAGLDAIQQVCGPYDEAGIEGVLFKALRFDREKPAMLSDALTDVLVTSYDIGKRTVKLFTKCDAIGKDDDYPITDVARATSAAPAYFKPHLVKKSCLIDGGIPANNPAALAYTHAKKLFPGNEYVVLSIGTGFTFKTLEKAEVDTWDALGWAVPVMGMFFDGMSTATHLALENLLPRSGGRRRYFRLQPRLSGVSDQMDDAANVGKLEELTGNYIADELGPHLDEFMEVIALDESLGIPV